MKCIYSLYIDVPNDVFRPSWRPYFMSQSSDVSRQRNRKASSCVISRPACISPLLYLTCVISKHSLSS